ncbi:MAG: hypothetical protein HY318_03285 [Armatimonadetes bacterium]|nr:hypothetical protein [Armatimonadota bacterium]
MKKKRHPFDRFLMDTRLLEGKTLREGLRQYAKTQPDRQAYSDSRRRLAAEMGGSARSPVAWRLVWTLGYASVLAMAMVLSYGRGLDQGLARARLSDQPPAIARGDTTHRSQRPGHPVRHKPVGRKQPSSSSETDQTTAPAEELAAAATEELPLAEQSAQAYEDLAQSETDPGRKVEALDRAADIYATLLNDADRAVSTYQHQVKICNRFLSVPSVPDTSSHAHEDSQLDRLRLQREKARLEIALAKNAEGGEM